MPQLAANLTMLFGDEPMRESICRVKGAGFRGVEILFPYQWAVTDLQTWLNDAGLELVLLNSPPGAWDAGERGLAALPGRAADFRAAFDSALEYATRLHCPRIHVMAGIRGDGADVCDATFVENLRHAARKASPFGIEVLIEPLNDRDVPGYHLSRLDHASQILATVAMDNVGLQFDFYHTRIMEGEIEAAFRQHRTLVRHVQIAGLPGRHEPAGGEIDGRRLLRMLDADGYTGWVGCEYRPETSFETGLAWAADFGISGRAVHSPA